VKKHFWLPNAVATGLCILLFTLIALFLFSGCASKTDPAPSTGRSYPGTLQAMDKDRYVYRYTDTYGVTCYVIAGEHYNVPGSGISCNFPEKPQNLTDAEFLVLTSEAR